MIVVPPLTECEDSEQPVVPRIVGRLVVAVTKQMCDRIDRPRHVPHDNGPYKHTPDKPAESHLDRTGLEPRADAAPDAKNDQGMSEIDKEELIPLLEETMEVVLVEITRKAFQIVTVVDSRVGTHHPSHVCPQKINHFRRVRVRLFIRVFVVHPVSTNPVNTRSLHVAEGNERQHLLEPLGRSE